MEANGSAMSGDLYLMKIDEACDTIWTKRIGGSSNDEGHAVIQTSDKGFAVTGYTYSYGEGGRDVYLIKTDSNGNLQWQKWFGGTADEEGHGLVQTADGGFIIAARSSSFGKGLGDIWLIKTDSKGDTLWTKLLGDEKPDVPNKLIETSDGNYLLVGSYGFVYGSGYSTYWYLAKFNDNGDTLWTKKYGNINWSSNGYDVIEAENGNFLTVGRTYDKPAMLMKLNSNGDTLWSKAYDVKTPYGLIAIDKTEDDGYLLLPGEISGMYGAIEVLKINANGDVLFIDTIGLNKSTQATCYSRPTDILSIGDNDYIELGDGKIYNNSFWNITINRKGGKLKAIPVVTTTIEETSPGRWEQNNLILNYPNPFSRDTWVRYKVPSNGKVMLVIYDMHGRKIKTLVDETQSKGAYEINFDGSNLINGIYFCQLRIVTSDGQKGILQSRKMTLIK